MGWPLDDSLAIALHCSIGRDMFGPVRFVCGLVLSFACACGRVGFDAAGDASTIAITPGTLRVERDARIDVELRTSTGEPLVGVEVVLSAEGAPVTITQPGPSDASGRATGTVRAQVAGAYTLRAVAFADEAINLTAPVIVVPGPLLAFPFAEGSGQETTDKASNTKAMFRANTSWQTGRFGSGLGFDGNAWLEIARASPYFADYADHVEVSVEVFARPTAFLGGWAAMYELGGCANAVVIGHGPGGQATAAVMKDQVLTRVSATTALPLGQWTHLALVKTADTLLLYQDGIEVGRTAADMLWNTGGGIHLVGSSDQTESSLTPMCGASVRDWFVGTLDDIQLYDQALAPELIAQDLSQPSSP